jgi:endonuclease/exonuclease/phosphatase family metal-dependent hydrolase
MRVVVAFVALLAATACVPAAASDQRASLTVLTHNVLHGGPWSGFAGDGQRLERRMDLVADALAALRPDVVALQEAAVSRRLGDVAARLARHLGYHHVHAPARATCSRGYRDCTYGTGFDVVTASVKDVGYSRCKSVEERQS